jgi:hypothetical protein
MLACVPLLDQEKLPTSVCLRKKSVIMPSTATRPIRIAGASGGFTDRQRAIFSLAKCNVDVIVGDWCSECTMSWHGAAKYELKKQGVPDDERVGLFDPSFMDNLAPVRRGLVYSGMYECYD